MQPFPIKPRKPISGVSRRAKLNEYTNIEVEGRGNNNVCDNMDWAKEASKEDIDFQLKMEKVTEGIHNFSLKIQFLIYFS
ncbi:hypothetical protein P8452_72181 [Trifolium repens]|nr:hypothetical protein P8452_72181 [Trifolium repens]